MYNKLSLALTLTACNAISIKNQTQECEHEWQVATGCMHDNYDYEFWRYLCPGECGKFFTGNCDEGGKRYYMYAVDNFKEPFS